MPVWREIYCGFSSECVSMWLIIGPRLGFRRSYFLHKSKSFVLLSHLVETHECGSHVRNMSRFYRNLTGGNEMLSLPLLRRDHHVSIRIMTFLGCKHFFSIMVFTITLFQCHFLCRSCLHVRMSFIDALVSTYVQPVQTEVALISLQIMNLKLLDNISTVFGNNLIRYTTVLDISEPDGFKDRLLTFSHANTFFSYFTQ